MIRVAAFTPGRYVPSARFRVRQYIERLAKENIQITEYFPIINESFSTRLLPKNSRFREHPYLIPLYLANLSFMFANILFNDMKSYFFDIIFLNRSLLAGFPGLEFFLKNPMILDIDDAIWLDKPFGKKQFIYNVNKAEIIFAGNEFIAERVKQYNKKIEIIPTGIDTERYFSKKGSNDDFIIGWIGTSGNFPFLQTVRDAFEEILKKIPKAKLHIISDAFPINLKSLGNKLIFKKWDEKQEVSYIQEFDVGIMPLPDNEWTSGKCSFKMLQYMACEIPVIVSPVGMNKDVLSKGEVGFAANSKNEWIDLIYTLYKNKSLRKLMGRNGRKIIKSNYSTDIIEKKMIKIFNKFR